MYSVSFQHDEENPSCHHCHISKPIPLSELIRTHPLRSVVAKPGNDDQEGDRTNAHASNQKEIKKTKFSDEIDDPKNNPPPPPPPPPPSFISKDKKLPDKDSIKTSKTSSDSLKNYKKSADKSLKNKGPTIRPVHSFLHHVFEGDDLDKRPLAGPSHSSDSDSFVQPPTPPVARVHSSNSASPELILNVTQFSAGSNSSKSNADSLFRSEKSLFSPVDEFTQTTPADTFSRHYYAKVRKPKSEISREGIDYSRRTKKKKSFFGCILPSGLLFAGYGLLIVLAIVIAVALSQRERRISQPFTGGSQAGLPGRIAVRRPAVRTRIAPNVRLVPVEARPAPPVQQAAPVPAPTLNVFRDEDFDYFDQADFADQDFVLNDEQNNMPSNHQQIPSVPQHFNNFPVQSQAASQPSVSARVSPTVARAPANPRQQETNPRRGTPTVFRQEFNLNNQEEPETRGLREPAVKIVKSWSDRHADGTFSWGYLNTDGSFKNESKGIDCVVRGVYGYIDEATGETLSFPYESGNPCDPNAPDLYYDYDAGTLNSAGQVVQRKKVSAAGVNRKRPQGV